MENSFLSKILVFGRMIKFSHTIFALPFALSAMVLAYRNHPLTFGTFFWIMLALVAARSAAMGFNRLVDSGMDEKNPRTRMREIPAGQLSKQSAVFFVTGSGAIFIFAAAMLGNICFYFSFPVLFLLLFYSYTKRFTWFCHIYLGFVISLAPIGAWVAMTNSISWPVVFLSIALMTNITGFDILYACQDVEFDKGEGLFSIPAHVGVKKALNISSWLHLSTFFFFILVGFGFHLGNIYFITVAVIGVLLIIEHKLVKPEDLSNVNIAFFHINSIISVVLFLGIILSELFR